MFRCERLEKYFCPAF